MKIRNKILAKNIYLRSLALTDISLTYLSWLQDNDVNYFLETRHEKQTLSKIKQYVSLCNNSNNIYLFGIFSNSDTHIGNIKLGPIKKYHNLASISIFIGNKKYWGKGFATEAINALANFSFNNIGLNKLTAGMYSNNINSFKAFELAGFIKEGVRRKHYKIENKYINIIELGLLREEFKY